MALEDVSPYHAIRDIRAKLKNVEGIVTFILFLVMLLCGYLALSLYRSEDNLGAVPSYIAIDHAKREASDVLAGTRDLDADIRPFHGGWCVILHAAANDGQLLTAPVFVEQNGRAWRTDPAAAKKYDGGADGRYMPPGWAAGCRVAP